MSFQEYGNFLKSNKVIYKTRQADLVRRVGKNIQKAVEKYFFKPSRFLIMKRKILHILAQKPGKTGSGIFLQALLKEASKKNYEQSVIMGISQKDQIESFGFCEDIKLFPVRFETEKLPFPVVGMSDVMPYQSTRYQDMTDEMLKQWKSAFQKQIDKAINEFQPDLIISHHM